jgi:GT2 family glycosyltransferase
VTLSAVVVNYNSAEFTLECVRSLLDSRITGDDGAPGTLEVVVVDNDSAPADVERLAGLPPGVRLIRNRDNLGYGGAANVGFAACRGEYLALLNPDIVVHPGAMQAMADHLRRNPGVGAVGPRTWMDDGRTIQHPLNRLPRLAPLLRRAAAPWTRRIVRRESVASTRFSSRYWEAGEPAEIEMLSGACLVVRREVRDRVGGFDERFPLYFEDADWCRRIRKAGWRLVYLPGAEILHHYNMSAGRDPDAAERKRRDSEERYFRKVYGPLGSRLARLLRPRIRRRMRRLAEHPPWDVVDLGRLEAPPTLAAPGEGSTFLIEFAGTPDFEYAAATTVRGSVFRFPSDLWKKMPRGELFIRFLEPDSLRVRAVWRLRT